MKDDKMNGSDGTGIYRHGFTHVLTANDNPSDVTCFKFKVKTPVSKIL